jgi:23S rRNA (guanosine2251-2'-O)-methyltransferase
VILYGYHAVREALRAQRRKLIRLHATPAAIEKLSPELAKAKVTVMPSSLEAISALLPAESVHQGLVLEARPIEPLDVTDLPSEGLVLVLDQITDPHNVGAILRSAAAFGVNAIVTTERHSPILTGVLAKAASGGLEHVPLIEVVNLAQTLTFLGEKGYWRVGLDSDGPDVLADSLANPPIALVLGAEGKGLRRLTRERCDALARLDMPGAIKSLNVSNAAAIALATVTYAIKRQ